MNSSNVKAAAGLQATCWSSLCIQEAYMWCLCSRKVIIFTVVSYMEMQMQRVKA